MRWILKDTGISARFGSSQLADPRSRSGLRPFTEHGFKVLLRDFDVVKIDILETHGRDLFPCITMCWRDATNRSTLRIAS